MWASPAADVARPASVQQGKARAGAGIAQASALGQRIDLVAVVFKPVIALALVTLALIALALAHLDCSATPTTR